MLSSCASCLSEVCCPMCAHSLFLLLCALQQGLQAGLHANPQCFMKVGGCDGGAGGPQPLRAGGRWRQKQPGALPGCFPTTSTRAC